MRNGLLLIVLLILAGIMIASVDEMPGYRSADVPSYNENTEFYLENATEEGNSPNVVSAIITDFRAFDTLGEATVLFTSIAAVITVLQSNKSKRGEH